MYNINPIPRHLLAKFLTNQETIKAFEQVVANAGELIPEAVDEVSTDAASASANANLALALLDVLSSALAILSSSPVLQPNATEQILDNLPQVFTQTADLPQPLVDFEQHPYGAMYSNTSTTVLVALANTEYEVGADISGGLTHLMTFGGAHYLQADRGGIFMVDWSMSLTSGAGDNLEAGIMIDGVAQTSGRADVNIGNAGSKHEISGTAIIRLSALQQLSLFVMNRTAAADIDIDHVTFSAILIDRRVVT